MTNGDRVRTFSNELLALVLMCPKESWIDDDALECVKERDGKANCAKCTYDWLNEEEVETDLQRS